MNAYGVLLLFSIGMIVIPVGGFFAAKGIIFEGKYTVGSMRYSFINSCLRDHHFSMFKYCLIKHIILDRFPIAHSCLGWLTALPYLIVYTLLPYCVIWLSHPSSSSASFLTLLFPPAMLGYSDGSVGAAIVSIVLIHTVIAGYLYTAWKDGPTTLKLE